MCKAVFLFCAFSVLMRLDIINNAVKVRVCVHHVRVGMCLHVFVI